MISQQPFRTDLKRKEGLAACMSQSVTHVRFTEDTQMSNWNVPKFTEGRYVRLQLESSTFLHFAQVFLVIEFDRYQRCLMPGIL